MTIAILYLFNLAGNTIKKRLQVCKHVFKKRNDRSKAINNLWPQRLDITVCSGFLCQWRVATVLFVPHKKESRYKQ